MPKTPKIDVITAKLICHIPVDRSDRESVDTAYAFADHLRDTAAECGQTTVETRLNRVPAPEPADDGLDIPDNLQRTAETEPAAAE
jgi:hypothetical protein